MRRTYEPTSDQLIMLRALMHAPRYLIIRRRAWTPVVAIMPCFSKLAVDHILAQISANGEHAQLVSYRPDEEDLGPFEPAPMTCLVWFVPLVVFWGVAAWLLWRLWH